MPSSGKFGVADGSYDPNDWPHAGFYSGDKFTLNVTITNNTGTNASTTAAKSIRRRQAARRGITVYQWGALGDNVSSASEAQFEDFMLDYARWCNSVALQLNLDGAIEEPIDVSQLQKLSLAFLLNGSRQRSSS